MSYYRGLIVVLLTKRSKKRILSVNNEKVSIYIFYGIIYNKKGGDRSDGIRGLFPY